LRHFLGNEHVLRHGFLPRHVANAFNGIGLAATGAAPQCHGLGCTTSPGRYLRSVPPSRGAVRPLGLTNRLPPATKRPVEITDIAGFS